LDARDFIKRRIKIKMISNEFKKKEYFVDLIIKRLEETKVKVAEYI
tara:strand:- start:1760 stop:1897 length:138 start_codon:yes stop_codon:yes gene_type:complete